MEADPRNAPEQLRDLPEGVTVGRHTYGHDAQTFRIFMAGAQIEVGSFASFGPEVRVLAGSEHVMTRATTFPLKVRLFDPDGGNSDEAIDRGVTSVGNDVWIGLGAIILSGVSVGDGAVVGAGTIVSKSVPPYAVVVGNPARIIRYRFDAPTRDRLLALAWWDWTDEEIAARKTWFMADVDSFLRMAEEIEGRQSHGSSDLRLKDLPSRHATPWRREIDIDPRVPSLVEDRVAVLEAEIADMRSKAVWRWAARLSVLWSRLTSQTSDFRHFVRRWGP